MNENPPPPSRCEPTFKAHNRITTSQTATITKSKHSKLQNLATTEPQPSCQPWTRTLPECQLTHHCIMTKDPHQEPKRKRERNVKQTPITQFGHQSTPWAFNYRYKPVTQLSQPLLNKIGISQLDHKLAVGDTYFHLATRCGRHT